MGDTGIQAIENIVKMDRYKFDLERNNEI